MRGRARRENGCRFRALAVPKPFANRFAIRCLYTQKKLFAVRFLRCSLKAQTANPYPCRHVIPEAGRNKGADRASGWRFKTEVPGVDERASARCSDRITPLHRQAQGQPDAADVRVPLGRTARTGGCIASHRRHAHRAAARATLVPTTWSTVFQRAPGLLQPERAAEEQIVAVLVGRLPA